MTAGVGIQVRALLHPPRPLVVGTLLLRAGINAAFVAWLWTYSPDWVDVFHGGAIYAIADGILGVLLSLQLGSLSRIMAPAPLVAVALIDGVLRLVAGGVLLAFPGIPETPITVVLFYGIIGAWAATAGIVAIVAAEVAHLRAHGSAPAPSAARAIFTPLTAEGVLALLIAVSALALGPPATAATLRLAAAVASGSLGVLLLVGAYRVARSVPAQA